MVLAGHTPREAIGEILRFVRFVADTDEVTIDRAVARAETATGDRNFALAHFMHGFGRLEHPVDHVLGVYFHQCAIAMTCRQLARAGLFLATGGVDPLTGGRVVGAARARRVGGGILAVAPGRASIAVWSPGLNANGNSLLGAEALELLAVRAGWSIFGE